MSKVYFTDLHTNAELNLLQKMERLVRRAGIDQIDFKDKFTAVKIHFGEPGNLAYIRHNYAAKMVEILESMGAKVFFTDSNTLYSGRRSNAVDHLIGASENGFNLLTAKAPVIIADGLKGTEYTEMPVPKGEICKTAKVGNAVANTDIFISMTHFKGHEMAGFGGTLKNIGMGCASRGGKMDLHSTSKPFIETQNCTACRMCVRSCNQHAITISPEKFAVIDYAKCIGCGQCVAVCRFDAAQIEMNSTSELMNKKIAEYTAAILAEKPNFHVSFIMNVSPECDCWASNDMAIVPDLGIAASFDPVALDMACADLVTAAPSLAGSRANPDGEHTHEGEDKFRHIHPNANWRVGLEHAEKLGLGETKYELIKI